MNPADSLAPFEGSVLESVADDNGLDPTRLRAIASRHQSSMDDLPGVENLRYEWRKQHGGTDLGRTTEAYFVAVPEGVWTEFGDALGLEETERKALATLHERQTRRTFGVEPPANQATYVVLGRE